MKETNILIEKFLLLLTERNSQINPGDTNYLEGYLGEVFKRLHLDSYQVLELKKNVEYLKELIN
jgi:hypothetical protein